MKGPFFLFYSYTFFFKQFFIETVLDLCDIWQKIDYANSRNIWMGFVSRAVNRLGNSEAGTNL